jgi:LemA protein
MVLEIIAGTIAVLLVLSLAIVWMSYNKLVTLAHRCDEAQADIDVYLKHRADIVPGLVETVRGFVSHERGVLDNVVKARAQTVSAASEKARGAAETHLGAAITQLFNITESYPQLEASGHFRRLREDLADTEHKIAASRRFLNLTVREYNARREQFPASLIANAAGMQPKAFFDLGVARVLLDDAPAVKF